MSEETTKHSAEPWFVYTGDQSDKVFEPKQTICVGTGGMGAAAIARTAYGATLRGEANAARIVACVNAMAGIDDPTGTIKDALEALLAVNKIVAEGAAVGFRWDLGGDWAQRLFLSQQATSAAIKKIDGRIIPSRIGGGE